MSDLDESGFDAGDVMSGDEQAPPSAQRRSAREDADAADAALEAEAEAAYEAQLAARQQAQQQAGEGEFDEETDGMGPERQAGGDAGFSDEDDGGAGAQGEGGAAEGVDAGSYEDAAAEEENAAHGGDPSSIQAPAGSSSAANEAAARLARLLAADQEDAGLQSEGEDGADETELELRQARKREIADLEAQLERVAVSGSRRSSQRGSAKRRGDGEEKESADDRHSSQRASHAASAKASYRSGGQRSGRAADPLDDELAGLDDDGAFDDGGFDDDGEELESEYGEGGARNDGHESDDEIRTADDVARAKEEREHLIEVNKIRQRQIAQILEREKALHGGKGGAGARGGLSSLDDKSSAEGSGAAPPEQIRSEYIKNLESLNQLWDELESKREAAENTIDRLTTKLDQADEKASELNDSFKAFKREVAKEARFSRTGKPIKLKRILAFEAAEDAAERDVARVRLRHINLLSDLRTLEASVRSKERLAEGLHLIDFEQLKIENQTLNEKIEERNDELHKLKKKTTTTVQVLTHIKEKLQCVREENESSSAELASLAQGVTHLRDTLTKAKHARDEARHENLLLKQKQGFIGSDMLVSDFEQRKGDIEVLRQEVEQLKARWRQLSSVASRAAQVERAHARMDDDLAQQRQTHYATVKFGGGTMGAGRR